MESKLMAGMIAQGANFKVIGAITEAVIPFGVAVKRGTDPTDQIKQWDGAAATDRLLGFTVYSVEGNQDLKQYDAKANASILRQGQMFVKLSADSEDVVAGDKVGVLDDGLACKAFTAGAATATYGVNFDCGEFITPGVAGDIVIIEINLPGPVTVEKVPA
jgi:hypothetical protein